MLPFYSPDLTPRDFSLLLAIALHRIGNTLKENCCSSIFNKYFVQILVHLFSDIVWYVIDTQSFFFKYTKQKLQLKYTPIHNLKVNISPHHTS